MSISIGHLDIPFLAAQVESSKAEASELTQVHNVISGARYHRSISADNSGSRNWTFDLGLDYALKGGIADYVAITRADIGDTAAALSGLIVQYSDNGSSYTTHYSGAVSLIGPRSEDAFVKFTATTAHRYWRVTLAAGTSGPLTISKIFLGQLFTFPEAPVVTFERRPKAPAEWMASSGTTWLLRADVPRAFISCYWSAVPDATIKAFEDKISGRAHRGGLMLYNPTNPDLLENATAINVQLMEARARRRGEISDYWELEARFEEVIG